MIAIKKACGVNWIYAVNATRCISIIAVLAGRVKGFFIKIWMGICGYGSCFERVDAVLTKREV